MLGTMTRPSPPDPAKSAEDNTLCRALVTISRVLTHCRENLPGDHQQSKRVPRVSHGLREVHHNAQAWVRRSVPNRHSTRRWGWKATQISGTLVALPALSLPSGDLRHLRSWSWPTWWTGWRQTQTCHLLSEPETSGSPAPFKEKKKKVNLVRPWLMRDTNTTGLW